MRIRINRSLIALTGCFCLLVGCGPSQDDILAACVEMGETRNMDGARRIRILRDLGVSADALQRTHGILELKFKGGEGVNGCVKYLKATARSPIGLASAAKTEAAIPESVGVLAAVVDLEENTPIRKTDAKYIIMPKDVVPPGAHTQFDDLEGMVSERPVLRGQLFLHLKQDSDRELETLPTDNLTTNSPADDGRLVRSGYKATTLRVSELTGYGELLLPTDAVMPGRFISLITIERNPELQTVTNDVFNPRLKILAVDQRATTPPSNLVVLRAVTLEVPPEEADRLKSLRDTAAITFSVR